MQANLFGDVIQSAAQMEMELKREINTIGHTVLLFYAVVIYEASRERDAKTCFTQADYCDLFVQHIFFLISLTDEWCSKHG